MLNDNFISNIKICLWIKMTILGHNFTKYKIDNNGIIVLANTKQINYVLSAVLTFIGAPGQ